MDAEKLDRIREAIYEANNSPEARKWWKQNPQLIPVDLFARAALAAVDAETPT